MVFERIHAQPAKTHSLQEHAIRNLQFIRDTMENASAFTAVPGRGMIFVGLTAIVTACVANWIESTEWWLALWLGEAVIAGTCGIVFMHRKSHQANKAMLSGLGWKFIMNTFVPMSAGIPLTAVLYNSGAISLLPGMWLLLYGTGIVTGGAFAVRIVPIMGFCFMATGTAALFSPLYLGDYYLAFGFGVLHLIFGIIISRKHGG